MKTADPERMKEKILRALEKEVLPQIEAKNISPQIYKIFDLSEAEEAQTVMRENRNTGKILLRLKKWAADILFVPPKTSRDFIYSRFKKREEISACG